MVHGISVEDVVHVNIEDAVAKSQDIENKLQLVQLCCHVPSIALQAAEAICFSVLICPIPN